jgi:hypothetical protein
VRTLLAMATQLTPMLPVFTDRTSGRHFTDPGAQPDRLVHYHSNHAPHTIAVGPCRVVSPRAARDRLAPVGLLARFGFD